MGDKISLYELNRCIAEVINTTFDDHYWVVAEISEIRTASNGHCYLELIEKSPRSNAIVARARATIWSNRWMLCRETFESVTGQRLAAGMKILVCVVVQMHEAYGFSLNIVDIDPSFTLGELALRRQEIIKRLNDEGIIDMNKEIDIPLLPQRIAIVSAQNAAGYGDFCHQLSNNDYGVCFYTHLFAAAMQGAATEKSIIAALDRIYRHQDLFDLVERVEKAGANIKSLKEPWLDTTTPQGRLLFAIFSGVSQFERELIRERTIVGIGHERDNTILDMVAHTSVKTPTAAAAFLIDRLGSQYSHLDELRSAMTDAVNWRIDNNHNQIARMVSAVKSTHIKLRDQIGNLALMAEKTRLYARVNIDHNTQRLRHFQSTITLCQPENILSRGFSITRVNGKAVTDASDIPPGTTIVTTTAHGQLTSITTD